MNQPAQSNQPPKCRWRSIALACETVRHQLYLDGTETPYFVDRAQFRAHYTQGQRVGLFGAGMHPRGIAAVLGSYDNVSLAKHRAEQFAMQAAA